ncbi:HNH endonuclease [Pedobacter sp.]|uniref:HNH endonuclease n=1 Tax=Pedobacter sp. TaxID=1411316 RepID=UPI003C5ECEE6
MPGEINFKAVYGEWGEGFIRVHHTKPVAAGIREVSPKDDMIVLCPNCHSMVHRKKNVTLSLDQLKAILKKK